MKETNQKTASARGTLYLVATPIGNLEDMTYRGVRILREADAVYCEDTRRTLVLLKHYGIERPQGIDSFHDHSPPKLLEKITRLLEEGKSVAYATDGGMPVVSDPGFVLVRAAYDVGATVSVIPGPSAAVTLFAASGLASPKYLFHGFFARTRGEVERTVEVIRSTPLVHIFYEAPGRIQTSLEILSRNLPENFAVLGRELTKMHEQIMRGTLSELHAALEDQDKVKGECVIAVMGGDARAEAQTSREEREQRTRQSAKTSVHDRLLPEQLAAAQDAGSEPVSAQIADLTEEQKSEIATLIKSGVSSKDAAKQLSKKFGVPRRVIYEFIIRHLT